MHTRNVPRLGPLYWATIAAASVFGTNTGDILSHTARLGDFKGVPFLAVAFALIWLAEWRSGLTTTLYYWLAIIVVRTAATNLADLGTLQAELSYVWFIVLLAAGLGAILLVRRSIPKRGALPPGIPRTDGFYWLAMLTAATLGTALGDYGSHTITIRLSLVLFIALFAAALWGVRRTQSDTALYWCTIVIVRAAGTNVGDLLAFKRGVNLGLPEASLLSGAVFFAFVLASDRLAHRRPAVATSGPALSPETP